MTRPKNKRRRPAQQPKRHPEIQEQPQTNRRIWNILRWVAFASGWIASVFLGLLDLPAKIVSFGSNASEAKEFVASTVRDYKRYEGRYTSDPAAWTKANLVHEEEPPEDQGEVQLAIEYIGDGRFRGELHSAYMAKHSFVPWSRVFLDGKLNVIGSFRGTVWDIVNNSRASYTQFTLTVADEEDGTLLLTPARDDGVFPQEMVLWPTDHRMADGIPGEKFRRILRETTRQTLDQLQKN